MAGINTLLPIGLVLREVGDKLKSGKAQCDGRGRFSAKDTAESINLELLGRRQVVDWKGKMKSRRHRQ